MARKRLSRLCSISLGKIADERTDSLPLLVGSGALVLFSPVLRLGYRESHSQLFNPCDS